MKLNSVAVLDPRSAAVVADVAVGRDPVRVVTGDGATWTINEADQTLSRIDPRTLRTQAIGLPGSPSGLAAADGTVVVGDGEAGSVSLIDPRTDSTQAVPLGSEQDERGTVLRFVAAVAPAGRDVWTVAGGHPPRLMRIEASGTARMHEATGLLAPDGPNGFAVSGGAAWSLAPGALTRVDLQRHVATQIPIGPAGSDTNFGGSQLPTGLATGAGGVWATNPYAALLEEVSPQTGAQLVAVRVPGRPTAVAIDGGTAWVVGFDGEVSALDVATGTVRKTVRLGHAATGVAAGYGRVWVTISGA